MKRTFTILVLLLLNCLLYGQTPYQMSIGNYSENFNDIANWTNGFASGIGANRWGSVGVNASGTIPDGKKTTTSTATFSSSVSGGVQKGTGNIILLSTGSSDNTSSDAIDLFLDFSNVTAGTLSFDWSEVNNSTGNRAGSVRIYTSTDGTTFTELTSAAVLNVINNVASSGSISTVALPSSFNSSSTARIRFYYHNGVGGSAGSRPKISIDNISVTAGAPILIVTQLTSGIAASPFTGGHTNKAIVGFSLQGTSAQNFTTINIQTSTTSVGKLTNIKVFKSTDNDYSTSGDNSQVSGLTINQTATEIQISGFSEALSGTPINFFVVTDIDLSVTGATSNVQPSFTETNITVSVGTVNTVTVTGTNYAFQPTAILLDAMEAGTLNYTEGDDATPITSTTTVAAVEANLVSGVIQITSNYQNGEDLLGFTNQNGITGSWDTTTGTLTLSGTTSVANYQTAVRSITYQNTSFIPNTSHRTISFTVNDGTVNSNTVTRNISVTSVDNAPSLAAIEAPNLNYTEGEAAKQIIDTITVSDFDNTTISSAIIQITSNYSNGQDILSFTNQNGITGVWTAANGAMSLSGVTTKANYQTALRSITYQNTSQNPNTSVRTVSFIVNDGALNSNTITRNINVVAVNNPPVITSLEETQLVFSIGSPAVTITQTISLSDPDNINLVSAEIKIAVHYQNGNDVLSFINANGIIGTWDASNGTITLSGVSSIANYQAALRSVTYQHTESPISNLYVRTISFKVNDGVSDSYVVNRGVNLGNTPPVLAGMESNPLEYKQGDNSVIITNGLTITDNGIPNLQYAVVKISNNYKNSEDVLSFTNQNTIIGTWYPSQGVLVLNLGLSLSNYETALRSVTYHNISSSPSTLPRTISFKVSDPYQESNEVTRAINITPVYTVALISNPPNGGITNGGGTFDPGNSVTVTTAPNAGYTFVNWTEGGTVVSTSPSYTIIINSNRLLIANFAIIQCTVIASSNLTEGGTTSGSGTFNYGSSVSVTATPSSGYSFVNWTSGGTEVSTSSTYTFIITKGQNLVANFMMLPILTVTPDFLSVGSIAGTASINVSNTGGGTMNWIAITEIFWIKITSGDNGTNNGIIDISYNQNNSVSRAGTITITAEGITGSPKSVEIRQGAAVTYVKNLNFGIPDAYRLEQNYPNPFNPTTKIRYGLPKESNVVITVYNILGEEITKLVNDFQYAGFYEVNFGASNFTSGIYIYRISAGSFMQLRKMLLIK
ncbi:MAG: T9SS C-terminal target domain-containing protein [Ignavibacteriales bacterium]|nr:MAG: T9SS C-terminal target domain-containing protein [Ignavibacteriales bacterium]